MSGKLPVDAVILAGGKGTRLRSVVHDRPKPMAEVNGRPFLEWLLVALRAEGFQSVILCTGYLADVVESHFGDGGRLGLRISYSREDEPLGTGGAIRKSLDLVKTERLLVMNGDSYCAFRLRALLDFHLLHCAPATLLLSKMDDCGRYGSVETDPEGRVSLFSEKTPDRRAGLVNAGIYLFERGVLAGIPSGQKVSLESDVLPRLVGHGLRAIVGDRPFLDIGTPEDYRAASAFLAANGLT